MDNRAKTRAAQVILSKPVCIDDFGTLVYRCYFTQRPTWADNYRFVGPFMTSVAGTYICHPDSKDAQRRSRALFDEAEANCNACVNFQRLPHDRRRDGFVKGQCEQVLKSSKHGVYALNGIAYWVHPDDPMHMPCWTSRTPELTK